MIFLLLQESLQGAATEQFGVEAAISAGVQWIRLTVEIIGALIVAAGVCVAVYQFLRAILRGETEDFNQIRLILARYLALALEFQLGADILSTAIAPSWEQIGKLGAVAIIRTGLNYFLMREMEIERTKNKNDETTQQNIADV
jgi:uncharacterized membrane protein